MGEDIKPDIRPVGYVRNGIEGPKPEGWDEVVSEIEIEPQLAECLDGIEGFSHIVALFWFHQLSAAERAMRKFHPRDREDLPVVGSFATRSQRRPNPIGLSDRSERFLERRGNVLRVQGLDALDGTPVLDIKPYSRGLDGAEEVRVPEWLERYWPDSHVKG